MPELARRSALEARQLEYRSGGLHMRESALAVLGLRLVRGETLSALDTRLGAALPTSMNAASAFGEGWIVGTEPGMWRVYAPAERYRALVRGFADLPATAGLASDLSSRFCTLELAGPAARLVIASACPLDMHPKAFETGHAAASVLLGSAVLIVKTSGAPSFLLNCERPHASIVWDWLAASAESASMPAHDAGRTS